MKESKLVQLFKMTQAVVTGEPPKDLGEHGEIRLRRGLRRAVRRHHRLLRFRSRLIPTTPAGPAATPG